MEPRTPTTTCVRDGSRSLTAKWRHGTYQAGGATTSGLKIKASGLLSDRRSEWSVYGASRRPQPNKLSALLLAWRESGAEVLHRTPGRGLV